MASFLVLYGTREGQTATVAERIRGVLVGRGHDVVTVRAGAGTPDVSAFDAVVVGSPLNNQAHLPEVVAFVRENRDALAARPTAFFQVSVAAALPYRWAKSGARRLADALFDETGWHPAWLGLFGGAVRYPEYDFFTRLAFRAFATLTTGDTDTSRSYEYTNWENVERFAEGFAAYVESGEGRRSRVARAVRRVAR